MLTAAAAAVTNSCCAFLTHTLLPRDNTLRHLPSLFACGSYLDVQSLHCLRCDLNIQLAEAGTILRQLLVLKSHVNHKTWACACNFDTAGT